MYSNEELEQQALIDLDQWGRLQSELGLEMLVLFSREFFQETREIWMLPSFNPFSIPQQTFQSISHRSAGAAGTMGFHQLRCIFLCLESCPLSDQSTQLLAAMHASFDATQAWIDSFTW